MSRLKLTRWTFPGWTIISQRTIDFKHALSCRLLTPDLHTFIGMATFGCRRESSTLPNITWNRALWSEMYLESARLPLYKKDLHLNLIAVR